MKSKLTIKQQVELWRAIRSQLRNERRLLKCYSKIGAIGLGHELAKIVALRHLKQLLRPSKCLGIEISS